MSIFMPQDDIKTANQPSYVSQSDYTESELLALQLGYVEIIDEKAIRGRYFLKDGKKWIHNIESLRKKLNAKYGHYIDDEELSSNEREGFGYAVEDYYLYNCHSANSFTQTEDFARVVKAVRLSTSRH